MATRSYCFTLNNYTADEEANLRTLDPLYLIYGKEIGDSGTPHLQGCVYFKNAKTLSATKKYFGTNRIHLEITQGIPQQASDYCRKENGEIYEYGQCPAQGKRNDLDEIREVIKTTGKMSEVVTVATSYQSVKMAEQILKYHEPKRNWKPTVEWYYGGTGTGKSHAAHGLLEDPYVALETAKWWDGYDAHENVIIDDMRKDFCKFHVLLRLLDRYAVAIETKGGTRQFLAKHIIITSCYHPALMFETREDIKQLLRRIDVIKEFTEPYI